MRIGARGPLVGRGAIVGGGFATGDRHETTWVVAAAAQVVMDGLAGYSTGFSVEAGATVALDGVRGYESTLLVHAAGNFLADLRRVALDETNALLYLDFGAGALPVVIGGARFRFGRDSAATMWAPNGALIEVVRNSPRVVLVDQGTSRVAALLLEPAGVNRCVRNVGHGTSGASGWTKTGAAAATLAAVNASRELARAGLAYLVPDGYALRLDNTGGATAAYANNAGLTTESAPHSVSVYARGSGSFRVTTSGAAPAFAELTGRFERYQVAGLNAGVGEWFRVEAAPGSLVEFVLGQLEGGAIVTEPVRNATDAAVVRAMDVAHLEGPPQPGEVRAVYVALRAGMSGAGGVTSPRILEFSGDAGEPPRLAARFSVSGVDVLLDNGVDIVTADVPAPVSPGDLVEVVLALAEDGSGDLVVSVNGSDPATASWPAPAAGLPTAWNRLWLNSSGTNAAGRTLPAVVKVTDSLYAESAPYWMEELRNFLVEPSGLAIPPE